MEKGTVSTFVKGAAAGMVVAAAAITTGKIVMDNNHSLAKGSGKALKAVGDFVDGIHTMFK